MRQKSFRELSGTYQKRVAWTAEVCYRVDTSKGACFGPSRHLGLCVTGVSGARRVPRGTPLPLRPARVTARAPPVCGLRGAGGCAPAGPGGPLWHRKLARRCGRDARPHQQELQPQVRSTGLPANLPYRPWPAAAT